MSNININDEPKIERTSWNIVKPTNHIQDFLNLLKESNKNPSDNHIPMEQIFSKELEIPKLVDFSLHNLFDDSYLIQMDVSNQRKIDTVGGLYFYQCNETINLILTNKIWLIDTNFNNIKRNFQAAKHTEIDPNINYNWNKILDLIISCKRLEIRNLKYLYENFLDYGKISSMSVNSFQKDIYGKKLSIFGNVEDSNLLKSTSPYQMESINSLSFITYLSNKKKLSWSINRKGKLNTFSMDLVGINKLVEIILDLMKYNVFFFQSKIYDFIDEV